MIYGPKDDGTYVVEFMMTKPYFFPARNMVETELR
jgi:hypothetical protein